MLPKQSKPSGSSKGCQGRQKFVNLTLGRQFDKGTGLLLDYFLVVKPDNCDYFMYGRVIIENPMIITPPYFMGDNHKLVNVTI